MTRRQASSITPLACSHATSRALKMLPPNNDMPNRAKMNITIISKIPAVETFTRLFKIKVINILRLVHDRINLNTRKSRNVRNTLKPAADIPTPYTKIISTKLRITTNASNKLIKSLILEELRKNARRHQILCKKLPIQTYVQVHTIENS